MIASYPCAKLCQKKESVLILNKKTKWKPYSQVHPLPSMNNIHLLSKLCSASTSLAPGRQAGGPLKHLQQFQNDKVMPPEREVRSASGGTSHG